MVRTELTLRTETKILLGLIIYIMYNELICSGTQNQCVALHAPAAERPHE